MNKATRLVVAGATVALALLALTVVGGTLAQGRTAVRAPADVILVRCSTTSPNLRVTAYARSSAAPAKKSDSCAETIALLTQEGFAIQDIGHYDDENLGYVVYTFVR